ncbi:unnamed protein product [Ceratitis capitata]|uniref:(Mediterranean fruit fly) hypothetical protein n=1 Tax=Ceratitis capitata TaxID=7213 RepID=A0A811V2F4_CERCA|nr:unnamed protein product [Ceratitis capitata]
MHACTVGGRGSAPSDRLVNRFSIFGTCIESYFTAHSLLHKNLMPHYLRLMLASTSANHSSASTTISSHTTLPLTRIAFDPTKLIHPLHFGYDIELKARETNVTTTSTSAMPHKVSNRPNSSTMWV